MFTAASTQFETFRYLSLQKSNQDTKFGWGYKSWASKSQRMYTTREDWSIHWSSKKACILEFERLHKSHQVTIFWRGSISWNVKSRRMYTTQEDRSIHWSSKKAYNFKFKRLQKSSKLTQQHTGSQFSWIPKSFWLLKNVQYTVIWWTKGWWDFGEALYRWSSYSIPINILHFEKVVFEAFTFGVCQST